MQFNVTTEQLYSSTSGKYSSEVVVGHFVFGNTTRHMDDNNKVSIFILGQFWAYIDFYLYDFYFYQIIIINYLLRLCSNRGDKKLTDFSSSTPSRLTCLNSW